MGNLLAVTVFALRVGTLFIILDGSHICLGYVGARGYPFLSNVGL